ncbi:MAG: hypothetical protein ARM1_0622 [Candidatus Micrarchaeota archaeon]|nr:MAG: hypothetical protein ARM1_0622 [Candidatus Micrarchaeota archaeon]
MQTNLEKEGLITKVIARTDLYKKLEYVRFNDKYGAIIIPDKRIIEFALNIVENYDKFISKIIKGLKRKLFSSSITATKINNSLEVFEKTFNITKEIFNKMENVNPITYYNVSMHFTLADIILKNIKTDSIKEEELKGLIERIDIKKLYDSEDFKLGVFVGLAPLLVTAALSNSLIDNMEFQGNYGALIHRFGHIVAHKYVKDYLEATDLNKPFGSKKEYKELIKELYKLRYGYD